MNKITKKCPFREIVDLPTTPNTLTQCQVYGAYRMVKLAFQMGEVYPFPSYTAVSRWQERPSWRRVGNTWEWHTVKIDVSLEFETGLARNQWAMLCLYHLHNGASVHRIGGCR